MNEQQRIIEGIALGNQLNNAIADKVAANAQKMLDQALSENYETILQAKLNAAVQETLNLHTARAKAHAQQFLAQSRTQMAGNLIETQHRHSIAALTTNLDLNDLDCFDCDLTPEVARLADESGTITIDLNNATDIGF